MEKDYLKKDLNLVIDRIHREGLRAEPIIGVERTVVAVVGDITEIPEMKSNLEETPGVAEVQRISTPYKLSSRQVQKEDTIVDVSGVKFGAKNIVVIAGPCAVESEKQTVETAIAVKKSGAKVLRGGAFKPRASPYSFQGLEKEGLKILSKARKETGLPVATEVISPEDVELVSEYSDILQIGARNAQNFPLLKKCGKAKRPIILKRGLGETIEEWLLSAEYILEGGNKNVILCERGIRTFEVATRFTLDIDAIPLTKNLSHLPVIGDPSHGTGKRILVKPVAKACIAAGADGLIIEVHPNPEQAKSDSPQQLNFSEFEILMREVRKIARADGRKL
ncbi:MAG: 3-deoxy-7-phosphoheptulonate synthase [Candidatus Woykebacteria bacterium]